ncbi:MAG: Asp-tRNA(Asn)/Glu-tRNA(Gln) amidotransferase subunit GatA [Candidatus Pacebacteria bacterium]|jgi:aspartyl-tRNA(Asn)/glutamyl-tRNA(Gln) amidotransferase subunit A|nr:Asp-tRNA(Asn)/Glu-tRNA(Gln) amidotransferase subunit GatA [Candidatus Paceibacterota bacterium]
MKKTLKEIQEDFKNGSLTVEALVEEAHATISEKDEEIHAILGMYSDDLIESQIARAKSMLASGTGTLLTGVPIVLKDNIVVEGERATAASKILAKYTSPYDATVVQKLKDAGAILLARANMDEFAMGGSTENSAFGVTKNPHDTTRVAGGSSGGSAAVVAYGGVPISLGSDTGGSIRQPASFCGIVGLKPTYGAVSRYGLMAMGSSLDQIGPFGNTIDDVEAVFDIIKGKDALDGTSVDLGIKTTHADLKKKIGVPWSFVRREGIDAEVLKNFEASLEKLKTDGYEIVDVNIEHLEKSLSVYYVVVFAEISSNMARYDGIRYGLSLKDEDKANSMISGYFKTRTDGLGDEVRRRVLLGTYVLSSGYYDAYYNKANLVREMLQEEFAQVFKDVDAIALPTSPIPAFAIGEKSSDPLAMYLADIFTVPVNIVGVPAISIPSGKTESGLPLSLQLIAPHFHEGALFTIGRDFEKVY